MSWRHPIIRPWLESGLNKLSFVGGLEREDPDHMWFWAHEDEGPPVWQPTGRQARHNSRERFLNEIRSERE